MRDQILEAAKTAENWKIVVIYSHFFIILIFSSFSFILGPWTKSLSSLSQGGWLWSREWPKVSPAANQGSMIRKQTRKTSIEDSGLLGFVSIWQVRFFSGFLETSLGIYDLTLTGNRKRGQRGKGEDFEQQKEEKKIIFKKEANWVEKTKSLGSFSFPPSFASLLSSLPFFHCPMSSSGSASASSGFVLQWRKFAFFDKTLVGDPANQSTPHKDIQVKDFKKRFDSSWISILLEFSLFFIVLSGAESWYHCMHEWPRADCVRRLGDFLDDFFFSFSVCEKAGTGMDLRAFKMKDHLDLFFEILIWILLNFGIYFIFEILIFQILIFKFLIFKFLIFEILKIRPAMCTSRTARSI